MNVKKLSLFLILYSEMNIDKILINYFNNSFYKSHGCIEGKISNTDLWDAYSRVHSGLDTIIYHDGLRGVNTIIGQLNH